MAERDLTLVGLTEDKQRLVLVSDAGQEFTLPADARLRAALRGEDARLGQLEITMESTLRPRDIQARIRAGQTPEKVAAAAQTTVDKIMAFAAPVLAERAHIAGLAQRASVRRSGQGPSRVLADAVAERLRARGVEPDEVEWDAWRREDGRWTVVADYLSGESARHAGFLYDAPGRYVVAEDDEARWLLGEQQASSHGPQPRSPSGPRRLTAVDRPTGTRGPDGDALPLGEDAIDLVSEDRASFDVAAGDADWIATQATERYPDRPQGDPLAPSSLAELGSEADQEDTAAVDLRGTDPQQAADQDSAPGERAATEGADAGQAVEPGDAAEEVAGDVPEEVALSVEEPDEDAPRRARRTKRASVPSWDEIMFGGGGRE